MKCVWIVLSLLLACTCALAQSTNCSRFRKANLVRLSDHLMNCYKRGIRPVQDWRQTTTVNIDIIIYAILGVDEKNQLLRTYLWSIQYWVDEFLSWDPQEFGNITRISIPAHMVWIPDIMVMEFVESTRSPETPFVYVNHKGIVCSKKPLLISTACSLNIHYFPFDTQKCTISFTSGLHYAHDVNVSLMDIKEKLSDFKSNSMTVGEWTLINVMPKYKFINDHDIQFGGIEYTVIIRRKPLFYTINLILPSMFLMIIDIFGFYLPPECGERISFKITLLLGYSVFLVVVKDILPATGTPLIGIYFIMCMSLLVTSLIESIIVVRMIHQHNHELPRWVKSLILEKIAGLLRIKEMEWTRPFNYTYENSQHMEFGNTNEKGPHCSKENSQDNIRATEGNLSEPKKLNLLTNILKEIKVIKDDVKDFTDQRIKREWLQVGYILDTFLFRMYLSVVTLYATSLMIIWSSKPPAFQ